MYKVQFTLMNTTDLLAKGKPITIYFSNTLTVIPNIPIGGSIIQDGNHNNGGWMVEESYDEVIKIIDNALERIK